MKTQISNLINGSEFTIRDLSAEKYKNNPIGAFCGKHNVPELGGTPTAERNAIAAKVALENPAETLVRIKGFELTMLRHTSISGKSWRWEAEVTPEQFEAIADCLPVWTHKGAENMYKIVLQQSCTVLAEATSGKKEYSRIIGEEFVEIL